MHDQKAYDGFEHFVFEFMPEPDWTALPIPFVAEVKALPNRFEQCNSWINSQFHQWADMDEAYELDAERLAYYALKSCELASKIRVKLKADDDQLDDLVTHFRHIIDKRRERYKNNPDFYVLIPELRAQFDNE
jgi:hypothetical protein